MKRVLMSPWLGEGAHGCPYPPGKLHDESANRSVDNPEARLGIISVTLEKYATLIAPALKI